MALSQPLHKLVSLLVLAVCFLGFIQVACASPLVTRSASIDQLVGYATTNGSTTGGAGGSSVTVTTAAAFTSAVTDDVARIVHVSGIIDLGNVAVKVGSHKSILGVGASSGFTNGGLLVHDKTNVIIRNLKLSFAKAPIDLIGLNKATNVWVDHNEFFNDQSHGKDYYDGQLDITHACDWVTVSWNYFHDHFKTSLVGHSDKNSAEDTGHLHVTYHHNHFFNTNSRLPSIRFGSGHIYNNFYQNGATGVHSREGAKVLVQNSVFINVTTPVLTHADSPVDGYVTISNNDFGTGVNIITQTGAPSFSYAYTLDDTASVESIVVASAGVGKITP